MARAGDPLEKVMAIESVRASYVFSPTGELVATREGGFRGTPTMLDRLAAFVRQQAALNRDVSEMILFYPMVWILFRVMGDRMLVIVADSHAGPSLLRVTLDVLEHAWRAEGVHRVFPAKKGGGSGTKTLARIFGKRRP